MQKHWYGSMSTVLTLTYHEKMLSHILFFLLHFCQLQEGAGRVNHKVRDCCSTEHSLSSIMSQIKKHIHKDPTNTTSFLLDQFQRFLWFFLYFLFHISSQLRSCMAACVLQHFRFERFGLIYKEKVKFIVHKPACTECCGSTTGCKHISESICLFIHSQPWNNIFVSYNEVNVA